MWASPFFGTYIPVTHTLWAALWKIGAGEVWPFRVLNLSLHITNTLLVCFGVRRFGKALGFVGRSDWIAAVAAGLFALHPLQVHTVAWVSGGRDLLAAFFALSALLIFSNKKSVGNTSFSTLFFALALLSKPSVASVPLAVILFEYLYRRRVSGRTATLMSVWTLLSIGVAICTFGSQGEEVPDIGYGLSRAWIVLDTFGFHLNKVFFPVHLTADYGRTPFFVLSSWTSWIVTVPLAICVLVGCLKAHNSLRFGILWFILLLPVSGIVRFVFQLNSTVSDHYNYLPLAVIAACAAAFLGVFVSRKIVISTAVFAVFSLFAFLSWQRVDVWRDSRIFFEDMAAHNPSSYIAAVSLAVHDCSSVETSEQGLKRLEIAFKVRPQDLVAAQVRAACLFRLSRFDQILGLERSFSSAKFVSQLEQHDPAASSLFGIIGLAWFHSGRLEKALSYFCEAFRILPTHSDHAENARLTLAHLKRPQNPETECPAFVPIFKFVDFHPSDL